MRKIFAIGGLCVGLLAYTGLNMYLGDKMNFNDKVVYPLVYGNKETEDGFTEDPFDLEKRIIINENDRIETYFGNCNENRFFPVGENDMTGYSGKNFREDLREFTENVSERVEEIGEDIGEAIENIRIPEDSFWYRALRFIGIYDQVNR
ncbi:MAG: hypothetical protein ACLFPQ_02905 [Candidatus Woesearchaeota archaeon]